MEPHSESCVAMERRSRAAVVCAWMRRLVDFMRRWRRCEGEGGREVRREEREKRWWVAGGAGVEEVEVPVEERLEERMERARFLRGGVSWEGEGGEGGGTTGERRSGSWLRGFCATTTWWRIGGGGGGGRVLVDGVGW